MSSRVVVLFALEREAAPFRRANIPSVSILVCGVGSDAARMAADAAIRWQSPDIVVMAGFGGALIPSLTVGDVAIATDVSDEAGSSWPCLDVGQQCSRLLSTSRLISTPSEKRLLAERHRAVVVDMESAGVAAVCEKHSIPLLAVRAVSDTIDTALSPRLVKLLCGGRVSPLRAALALVRQPSLAWEFRRLARDTRIAARKLAASLADIMDRLAADQRVRR